MASTDPPPEYQYDDLSRNGSLPSYTARGQGYDVRFVARDGKRKAYLLILLNGTPTYRVETRTHGYLGASTEITFRRLETACFAGSSQPDTRLVDIVATLKIGGSLFKDGTMEIKFASGSTTKVEKINLRSSVRKAFQRYGDAAMEAYRFCADSSTQPWIWTPHERAYADGSAPVVAIRKVDEKWDHNAMELQKDESTGQDPVQGSSIAAPRSDMPSQAAKMTLIHFAPFDAVPRPPRAPIWETGVPVARLDVLDEKLDEEVQVAALFTAIGIEKIIRSRWGLGDEEW